MKRYNELSPEKCRLDFTAAIEAYLLWLKDHRYAESTISHYKATLLHFERFLQQAHIPWMQGFSLSTLNVFKHQPGLKYGVHPVCGLSRYLWQKGMIAKPIERKPLAALPDIYEQYMQYHIKTRNVHHLQQLRVRATLHALNRYLEQRQMGLAAISIDQIDRFLAERNAGYCSGTQSNQRSNLKGFLRYLYEQGVTRRDLSPLVVGAVQFARTQPPRFLTSDQIEQLFAGLKPVADGNLRAYAMLHLAFWLGLRPVEISRITLDDICFKSEEILLPARKSANPIKLPLPEPCIKAIAAYIVGSRPESTLRTVFLQNRAPYHPVSAAVVGKEISDCMKQAGLCATAYHLRHSYAQRLLESGCDIIDIKHLLGHDRILTTQRYLHIHKSLMRKVLFDETL